MEEKKNIFIAFIDDDGKKKEDWIILIEKNISYVKFNYNNCVLTIPWHRILKLKEVGNNGN